MELLREIAKEVGSKIKIPTYERSVENILLSVKLSDDFWEIVKMSSEPLNLVAEVIKSLEKRGIVKILNEKILLTENGQNLIESLGIGIGNHICPKCLGRTVVIDNLDPEIISTFKQIVKSRPSAVINYDQGYILPEVTLARVALMDFKGDLRGRKIIILGDDDLVSIAIGLTQMAKELAVVEIDERLTSFIEKTAEKYGFDVDIYTRDLRDPLPDELIGRFDVFETDPPETLPALKLFIGRGIAALRGEKCAGYFGLTLIDASLDKWREFQRILVNEFNVVITDVIRNFNVYENWPYVENMHGWGISPVKKKPETNWFVSTMYRIETLRGFKGFNEPMPGDIYYDEELATA